MECNQHAPGDVLCLIPSTASHTWEFELPNASSLHGTCGQASMQMCAGGHAPVSSVSVLRSNNTVTPLSSFPAPDARFHTVHIDLVGPLPPSRGFTYLLTCVDRFTRWPEAFPISAISADVVAQTFSQGWIAHFGVPSTIITDRGRQFESKLWSSLMAPTWLQACSYHLLPPSFQWHGGAISPAVEGCSQGPPKPLLDGLTAISSAGNSDSVKGRHSCYCS